MTTAYETPREGTRVAGRYVLAAPHADRGLGDAWRAQDLGRAERLVKFHPLGDRPERDALDLVARLKRSSAGGVATVLDGGVWEGRLFLAYEPCGGRSLQHWLEGWRTTRTPPTAGTVQTLFRHLCTAVHAAHGKDLAHERLNPRSVVVTSLKAAQPLALFDCGVAAFLSGDDHAACAPYLSPEQVERPKKGSAADARRADLFALGVILAELLTLRATPREGTRQTWEQLVRASPKRDLASLTPRPEDVPEEVWRFVEQALFRRDEKLSNAMAIRQAAGGAWDAANARDESPGSFREAPMPVAAPPAQRPSRDPALVEARELPAAPERPSREADASQRPARPAVVQAFSVPVERTSQQPASTPPRPPVSPARPPVPATPPVAATRAVAPAPAPLDDVGGDTLVDFDDDDETALASRRAVQAMSASPIAPVARRASASDEGGDTMPLVDAAPGFDASLADHDDGGATLQLEGAAPRPPVRAIVPPAPPPYETPSDPFAGVRKRVTDTLPLDDDRSPLAAPAPRTSSPQTIDRAPPARPRAFAPANTEPATLPLGQAAPGLPPLDPALLALSRNTPSDTLPIEGGALPMQSPRPAVIAPIAPRTSAPSTPPRRAPADRTDRLPVQPPPDASFWTPWIVLGVVVAGVALGLLIVAMLRAR